MKLQTMINNAPHDIRISMVTLREEAEKIGDILAKSSDDIMKTENILMRQPTISRDKERFEKTLQLSYDLAAGGIGGGDPNAVANMLGKAMFDPTKAGKLLMSAGIDFNKKELKSLKESGQSDEARERIVNLLTEKYKDFAVNLAKTDPLYEVTRSMEHLKDVIGPLAGQILTQLTPYIVDLATRLKGFLEKVTKEDIDKYINNIKIGIETLAIAFAIDKIVAITTGLTNLAKFAGSIGLTTAVSTAGEGIAATGLMAGIISMLPEILIAGAVVGAVVLLAKKVKDDFNKDLTNQGNQPTYADYLAGKANLRPGLMGGYIWKEQDVTNLSEHPLTKEEQKRVDKLGGIPGDNSDILNRYGKRFEIQNILSERQEKLNAEIAQKQLEDGSAAVKKLKTIDFLAGEGAHKMKVTKAKGLGSSDDVTLNTIHGVKPTNIYITLNGGQGNFKIDKISTEGDWEDIQNKMTQIIETAISEGINEGQMVGMGR